MFPRIAPAGVSQPIKKIPVTRKHDQDVVNLCYHLTFIRKGDLETNVWGDDISRATEIHHYWDNAHRQRLEHHRASKLVNRGKHQDVGCCQALQGLVMV